MRKVTEGIIALPEIDIGLRIENARALEFKQGAVVLSLLGERLYDCRRSRRQRHHGGIQRI